MRPLKPMPPNGRSPVFKKYQNKLMKAFLVIDCKCGGEGHYNHVACECNPILKKCAIDPSTLKRFEDVFDATSDSYDTIDNDKEAPIIVQTMAQYMWHIDLYNERLNKEEN